MTTDDPLHYRLHQPSVRLERDAGYFRAYWDGHRGTWAVAIFDEAGGPLERRGDALPDGIDSEQAALLYAAAECLRLYKELHRGQWLMVCTTEVGLVDVMRGTAKLGSKQRRAHGPLWQRLRDLDKEIGTTVWTCISRGKKRWARRWLRIPRYTFTPDVAATGLTTAHVAYFDGSYSPQTRRGAWGFVIEAPGGRELASGRGVVAADVPVTSYSAEAIAAYQCLRCWEEIGLETPLEIRGDLLPLVQTMNQHPSPPVGVHGALTTHAGVLVLLRKVDCSLRPRPVWRWVPRRLNRADALARESARALGRADDATDDPSPVLGS